MNFGNFFVDDKPVHRYAINIHATVKSKAVLFSFAMSVLDNIYGWEEEEKWMGSLFAAEHDEKLCTVSL